MQRGSVGKQIVVNNDVGRSLPGSFFRLNIFVWSRAFAGNLVQSRTCDVLTGLRDERFLSVGSFSVGAGKVEHQRAPQYHNNLTAWFRQILVRRDKGGELSPLGTCSN